MSAISFVDTHAHLTDEQFSQDLEAVLERAASAGVARIVTLGTDVASSRAAVELAERYPAVCAAVGIHPEAVRRAGPEDLEAIRALASHRKVVAIGEIGLDYYWDKDSAVQQRTLLELQLDLAADLGLPVAIHDRDAHADILNILKSRAGKPPRGVLHSFSGDASMANEAIGLGMIISLAGPITFLNARRAPALVTELPPSGIVIETDSPYLSPHPLRGRRNEPANVVRVAARIAELKRISVEQVAELTTRNAQELFRFEPSIEWEA